MKPRVTIPEGYRRIRAGINPPRGSYILKPEGWARLYGTDFQEPVAHGEIVIAPEARKSVAPWHNNLNDALKHEGPQLTFDSLNPRVLAMGPQGYPTVARPEKFTQYKLVLREIKPGEFVVVSIDKISAPEGRFISPLLTSKTVLVRKP